MRQWEGAWNCHVRLRQIQSHRPGLGKSHPYGTRNVLWKHMDSWAKLGQLTRKGEG